jgi:DNA invertase Pin-like site-specific DNA recombinase
LVKSTAKFWPDIGRKRSQIYPLSYRAWSIDRRNLRGGIAQLTAQPCAKPHKERTGILVFSTEKGTWLQRPEFDRLQGDIFAGKVKTVIIWKLDRLSRNLRDGVNVLAD